jgi:hypothetical protein
MVLGTNGRRRRVYSGLWSCAVPQLIAFFISLIVSVSVSPAFDASSTSHHIKIHMPPRKSAVGIHGVSGGGPVGTTPIGVPTPPTIPGH